jgi:hypothetical protein
MPDGAGGAVRSQAWRRAGPALLAAVVAVALAPIPGPPRARVTTVAPGHGVETAAAHAEGAHTVLPILRPQPDGSSPAHARRGGGFHHRVYLAEVTNKGDFEATDAEMTTAVDQVLHRWVVEADGAISSFHRVGRVHTFSTSTDCRDGTAMWAEAKTRWPNVDFRAPGNHLVVLAPPGCDFGIGTIGRSLASGGEVEVRYDPHYFAQDLMHELGHNFSLRHADAQVCDPKCKLSHYDDHYSFMGASMYGGFEPPALESIVRSQLGIAQQCELPPVQLTAGQQKMSAVYDLFARSADTGTRGLRVRDPSSGTRYWVEWRNHAGRDALTSYGANARSSVAGKAATYDTGIVIEQRAADGDTYVLSYPEGAGLTFAQQAGQHYTSSDGALTVQVDAIGARTARVRVTLIDSGVTSSPALPAQRGAVTVHGAVRAGATVTAEPKDWTRDSCFRYRWYAGGTPIPGARGSTFTVPDSLRGAWLSVRVVGQRPGYAPRRARSEPRQI